MTLDEFIQNHFDTEYGEVFSDVEGIKFKRVHQEEEINHKTVTTTEVYHLLGTEHYFEVTQDRDNSGYWGDGERYEPEVRKVVPYTKTITAWKAA